MNTIPGGAYKLPDGSWINAQGKPIAAPRGDVYERPEVEVMPPAVPMALTGPGEEYARPEASLEEGEPKRARRVTKKKSS